MSLYSLQVKRLTILKLNEFQLSLEDIVAATTDGASVMIKFGKDIFAIHQICYNHALHLAVISVIFKKLTEIVADDSSSDDDSEYEESDNDSHSCIDDNQEDFDPVEILVPRKDINTVLCSVRKIVMMFKRSPVKNAVLQNYIKEKHGQEIALLMDCKTRWNSTEVMVERFLKLYSCVMLALTDLNATEHLIDDQILLLRDLANSLRPIKMAVESLSQRDNNLLKCEGVFKFIFDELKNQSGEISKEMLLAVQKRVYERRNQQVVSTMKYLQTKDLTTDSDLPILTKKQIHKFILDLTQTLFTNNGDCLQSQEAAATNTCASTESNRNAEVDTNNTADESEEQAMTSRLFNAISQSVKSSKNIGPPNLKKFVKQEIAHFECTTELGCLLKKLLVCLETIQPTSTESERVFSSSSNICTKKRSRLTDVAQCTLFFKKLFFKRTIT